MNYKLEREIKDKKEKLLFTNIYFDTFKINVIERYSARISPNSKLVEVFIKVRKLDDDLIKKKDGNIRIHLRDKDFVLYNQFAQEFNSFKYQSNQNDYEFTHQDFVYFILKLIIANYDLN